jgi:hypothetical protein
VVEVLKVVELIGDDEGFKVEGSGLGLGLLGLFEVGGGVARHGEKYVFSPSYYLISCSTCILASFKLVSYQSTRVHNIGSRGLSTVRA